MNKQIITIGLIFGIGSMAIAGPEHKRHNNGQHDRIIEDLNLTDEQRIKFDAIMLAKKESMKAAMDVIQEDTQVQLSKVLTDDQMKILENKKIRGNKRRFHRKNER